MGVHESTLRAAVADLVPASRRGSGYGTFTAVYGLAWLAGATIIGALYSHSIHDAIIQRRAPSSRARGFPTACPCAAALANPRRGRGSRREGVDS